MNKTTFNQTKKKVYVKPSINVIRMESEGLLGQFSGQHQKAHHETTPLEPEDE